MAGSVDLWLGTVHGRGLALAFVISASLGLAVSLLALANARLRNLDRFVPDGR